MQSAAAEVPRVRALELLISAILQIGVTTSFILVVGGTVLNFIHHPAYFSDQSKLQQLIHADGNFPHTPGEVIAGVGKLHDESLVMLGLLILIATPVARVTISIFGFILQHDHIFVVLTCVVLILLLSSFFLGRGVD